ncbi:hypothetical protein [Egicoccus sp. AB-alg2]|uniref:hypothetical protein n=1 Tax=Egicoccus sp. AB-alg2 TaxID=3242693 RepID=UPI00359D459E
MNQHQDERDREAADEALLAELRRVARSLDPVPADAVLAARSALAHLRLDAELAELVHDSETAPEPVGVRGQGTSRQLSFQAGIVEIDLEILVEGERRRLVGQCVPATALEITVRQPQGERSTVTDDLGRFVVEVPPGPVSLRCAWPHTEQVIETAWVRV